MPLPSPKVKLNFNGVANWENLALNLIVKHLHVLIPYLKFFNSNSCFPLEECLVHYTKQPLSKSLPHLNIRPVQLPPVEGLLSGNGDRMVEQRALSIWQQGGMDGECSGKPKYLYQAHLTPKEHTTRNKPQKTQVVTKDLPCTLNLL